MAAMHENQPDPSARLPDPATLCVRGGDSTSSATPPLAPALTLSSVYKVADLDQIDALYRGEQQGYFYARDAHPNARELASRLATIEGTEAGLVCASGMAAESALILACVGMGDEVALSDGLYGKTVTLVARELARFGVKHTAFDASRPETLRDALSPRTRLVFAETISNPLVRVADIAGLAAVLRELRSDALLAIDHTFAPLLCTPTALGAGAVVHSVTKLIGGHSDVTLGFVGGPKSLIDRVAALGSTFGLTGNPFDSWLALRGLATLNLRSTAACANALALAERLERHPAVRAVHYAGLRSHPDHDLACRQLRGGFGTIVTIDVGGRGEADTLIRSLRHVPFAPSLGDVTTTLSHPSSTSHRALAPEEAARLGINPGLVRLSIGLEGVEDLWDDFSQALGKLRAR